MPNTSAEPYNTNPHYLATLSGLLAKQAIVAEQAITARDGRVLLHSGSPMQAKHMALLPQEALKIPLEACLSLPDFTPHRLLQEKSILLLEQQPLLQAMLEKTSHRHACLAVLESLPLNHSLAMLLALLEQQQLLEHSLLCCLFSLGLALRTGQPSSLLEPIALAALFHDIGELYLGPRQPLSGSALGRHRMAHPLLGYRQMLRLGQHKQIELIAQGILQHHERLDGSGYPRGDKEGQLGIIGQLITVADLASQLLLHRDHPYQRLDIALRLIPGGFHRPSVSLVNRLARQLGSTAPQPESPPAAMDILHALLKHIGELTQLLFNLQEEKLSTEGKVVQERCMSQFDGIQRSLFSSGMQASHLLGQEQGVQLEIQLVCEEINWRLRNLGRDLSLAQDKLGPDDSTLFQALSSSLLESRP
ncbi:MAG: HD domain-containing protein [Aquitalea sp.]|nr:HD domain-containing protein [Aquitalea sp.]